MIGKLICWWTGKHRRGKRTGYVATAFGKVEYRCQRCRAVWMRKVKPKSADVLQIPSAKREST